MKANRLVSAEKTVKQQGPVRRAVRNAGLLLGSNGIGALFGLAYIGILTRSLAIDGFGRFALILAYRNAVANIVGFQSWQTVIRYGATHVAEGQQARMYRLLAFASVLDLGAAVVGGLTAAIIAPIFGDLAGWSTSDGRLTAIFTLSLIVSVRGPPTGFLRLINRFDLAALGELILPAVRLGGAILAMHFAASITGYLIAWSASELAATLLVWHFLFQELRRQGIHREGAWLRGASRENPNVWNFAWTTNLASSLWLFWFQVPVLAVGWAAGPGGAGVYRIASQIGNAASKPIGALTRSIYPEFARIDATKSAAALIPILVRTGRLAGLFGVACVALVALTGKWLLLLVGGQAYVSAYPMLVLMTIASAVGFTGFGLEPALVAMGRPGLAIRANIIATPVFCLALFLFIALFGPTGAALASITGQLCSVIFFAIAVRTAIRGTSDRIEI